MLKQQFDQSPFPGPEMSVHASTGQSMQHGYRLLRKESFKFVARHGVKC